MIERERAVKRFKIGDGMDHRNAKCLKDRTWRWRRRRKHQLRAPLGILLRKNVWKCTCGLLCVGLHTSQYRGFELVIREQVYAQAAGFRSLGHVFPQVESNHGCWLRRFPPAGLPVSLRVFFLFIACDHTHEALGPAEVEHKRLEMIP